MYSVLEKYYWIRDHIWSCSPVWFHCDGTCYGIYAISEVVFKNGRIYWRHDGDQVDITYYRLTAFESEGSVSLIQYGYEPIETIYEEGQRCMEAKS